MVDGKALIDRIVEVKRNGKSEADQAKELSGMILASALRYMEKQYEKEGFDVEKNQGKLRMAIGLLKGGNIELSAAGGKTFVFPMEMALQAVLAAKVNDEGSSDFTEKGPLSFAKNQVLVIKSDMEMKKALDETGEGGHGKFLEQIGLKMENGDALSKKEDSSELVASLRAANTITVFSMETFGHLRNRLDDADLLRALFNHDVVRFDEFHIPFSDRTTFINSTGSEKLMVKSPEKVSRAEVVFKAIDPLMDKEISRNTKIDEVREGEGEYYYEQNHVTKLSKAALERLKDLGLSEQEVVDYLSARDAKNQGSYTVIEKATEGIYKIVPQSRGEAQEQKVFSEEGFLAAMYARVASEGRYTADKLKIIKESLEVSKSSSQATLSETLRFKKGASIAGASGTLSSIKAMLSFSIGNEVMQAQPSRGFETVTQLTQLIDGKIINILSLDRGNGLLIFAKDQSMRRQMREIIEASGKKVIEINENTTEPEMNSIKNRIQKEGLIVISSEKGATGIDYSGTFDLVVADAHNWTKTDLIQAINRNNRGNVDPAKAGERILCYDGNKLSLNNLDASTKAEIRSRISETKIDGRLTGSSKTDLEALEYNARVKEAIEISDALVFQVREAAMSRGIIEQLKAMIAQTDDVKLSSQLQELLKLLVRWLKKAMWF